MALITNYLQELKQSLERLPVEQIQALAELILEARARDKQIFLLGNGGSAATASHFACDLAKGTALDGKRRVRVIALTDNIPLMTAWGNDTGYENIFVGQLANLLNEGDLVIGLSGSGRSKNVIKALQFAKAKGAKVAALTGFDGGMIRDVADLCLIVPSDCIEQIEDLHLVIQHAICSLLREEIGREEG